VGSNIEPSIERILAMRPDVVLTATSANRQTTTDEIEKLGIPVVVTRGHTLEQIFADIAIVGATLALDNAATALAGKLRGELAALQQKSSTLAKTSCAIIVWPEPLVVAGPGSHLDALLEIAGGTNIASDATQPFPSYSQERLIARAPQVLVYGTHKTQKPPDITALERLTTIPAVRDHRVHLADGDLLFRPGPRIAEGAATLFALLHPEGAR
jgi:iron complex transport system substrate-binding protein